MQNNMDFLKELAARVTALGATRVAVIDADQVITDKSFRDMCAANSCGLYGKCYTCPPDVGDIEVLMASLQSYRRVLVYQTVGELEDSFDYEGMVAAKQAHYKLSQNIHPLLAGKNALHLAAGGCGVCRPCAKQVGEPCRHPDKALTSLEAYGVNVSLLAKAAGMKYVNGQNTVTYFGAIFFRAQR